MAATSKISDIVIPVVEPVIMKNTADCGVACLAMLLGRPYADVAAALPARRITKMLREEGLSERQMQNVARRLGSRLSLHTKEDYASFGVGILSLDRPTDPAHADREKDAHEGHYVFFAKGTLFNPGDGQWWLDVGAFLATRRWKPFGILVRTL